MLNIKNLTNFINSVTQRDLENIEIDQQNTNIIINLIKNKDSKYISKPVLHADLKINKTQKQNIKAESQEENQIQHSSLYSTIVSPMVGTFYRAPAPNEPPFIEIGENVKTQQPVCIIEAMKLMNEIESEVYGEVVEILVKDGDIVDCGQSLIKVKIK